MYLYEQDVKVPLQNKFIKKNLCLKDLHSNEYLYNTLIKDNKIFNVNHKSIDQLNESFKFLDFLEQTTNNIIHTSPFELIMTNKIHLIADDFVIN